MNLKIIIKVLGLLLLVEGIAMLVALMIAIFYNGNDIQAFLISAGVNIGAGGLILAGSRNAKKEIGKREGFIIVTMVWVVFSLFGSFPYLLSGSIPGFTNAFI